MRAYPAALALGLLVAAPAAGAPEGFDGLYRQGPDANCTVTGVEGGALKIEDGVFHGVEMQCRMENPVDVRDMDAALYDMSCNGEGSAWTARALFMHAADGGLIMVWNGYAFKYDRCPGPADAAAGAADP
ncbi:hypothetical protein [Actibacterium sp. D379-3]